MRNIELLTQVRDLIAADPGKLYMHTWAEVDRQPDFNEDGFAKIQCATTACVAGWAVQLAGLKLYVTERCRRANGSLMVVNAVAKNGRVVGIEGQARKLLGLTWEEASWLFYSDNSEVLGILNALISGDDIAEEEDYLR